MLNPNKRSVVSPHYLSAYISSLPLHNLLKLLNPLVNILSSSALNNHLYEVFPQLLIIRILAPHHLTNELSEAVLAPDYLRNPLVGFRLDNQELNQKQRGLVVLLKLG